MTRRVHARGVKRSEVDEDQLAVAFLLLAKILHDENQVEVETLDSESAEGRVKNEEAA